MFGTSGVRGPFGTDVTAALALSIGRAVASDGADRVVIGRDPRTTGDLLADAAAAGARECGADVIDVGIAATPTTARSVAWRDADVGIVVTASHNPPEDNGLKLWQRSGQAFDAERRERIAERVENDDVAPADWDAVGERSAWDDAAARHVDAIVGAVADTVTDAATVGDDTTSGGDDATYGGTDTTVDSTADADGDSVADLDVVVDVGNGAGGLTVRALRELGCSVAALNERPDGRFPSRPSEPTEETLSTLQSVVAATDADLGIAHDGDADRTMAVDETGTFVGGDRLLALFAVDAVADAQADARESATADDGSGSASPATAASASTSTSTAGSGDLRVAAPVNTSLAVDDAIAEYGASVERTRVGDVYVAERASEPGVVFGGEPSGAWIWPGATLCPDGPLAACRLAAMVAERGPLSALVADVEGYPIRRDDREVAEKRAAMERIRTLAADRYSEVDSTDGVRIETDSGWLLVRASGTQPLIRLTAEARDADRADELLADGHDLLAEALGE